MQTEEVGRTRTNRQTSGLQTGQTNSKLYGHIKKFSRKINSKYTKKDLIDIC